MTEKDQLTKSLSPKVKTRKQVADEYGITSKTLNKRFKEENLDIPPGYLFPNTLIIIYETLGFPEGIKND